MNDDATRTVLTCERSAKQCGYQTEAEDVCGGGLVEKDGGGDSSGGGLMEIEIKVFKVMIFL